MAREGNHPSGEPMPALFARLCKALRSCRVSDLRFKNADEEALFKQSMEEQILRPLLVLSIVALGGLFTSIHPVWVAERGHEGFPFEWTASDPRTLYFSAGAGSMVMCAALSVLASMRLYRGFLRNVSWEHMATGMGVYIVLILYCMSAWHVAKIYGRRPEEIWLHDTRNGEFHTIFAQLAQLMAVCMYMPIRAHILWLVPMSTTLSILAALLFVGSAFPSSSLRIATGIPFMSLMQYQGARRHERQLRDKFRSDRRVEEQDHELKNSASLAGALQAMTGTMSDIVLMLSPDLRIVHTEESLVGFFGKNVKGCMVTEFLAQTDHKRFEQILEEAAKMQTMQSMPATLELSFATLHVQLTLIETCGRMPRYLVGMQTLPQLPEAQLAPQFLGPVSEERSADVNEAPEGSGSEAGERLESGSKVRVESVVSTTNTGQVFADLDKFQYNDPKSGQDQLVQLLGHIADVGIREHWLINTSEIELLPNRVLGSGGYGVVVMARLRGTAVAAKLPLQSETARSLSHVTSLSTEIRVHRHVRHSNIVLFYGACIDKGTGSIALLYEIVRGPRLDVYVRQSLPSEEVDTQVLFRCKMLLDVAGALRYLHSLRPTIVHGDIKPSNILVENLISCPRAKLMDFGLSRLMTKNSKPLGGTRQWMAPELVSRRGPPNPMPSADVYSFGLLAYFVVISQEPYRCIDTAVAKNSLKSHNSMPLKWTEDKPLSDECRDLCTETLRFDPKLRPSMKRAQENLLMWLPADPESLKRLGPEILTLLLAGEPWDTGARQLSNRAGPEPAENNADPSASQSESYVMESEEGSSSSAASSMLGASAQQIREAGSKAISPLCASPTQIGKARPLQYAL